MSYEIIAVPTFKKEVKKLAKKYHSLKLELENLFESLEENPTQGKSIGHNCYKIRISVAAKGKGKRGGARIITNIVISDQIVYLLSIYDKSEKETLTNQELLSLLKLIAE